MHLGVGDGRRMDFTCINRRKLVPFSLNHGLNFMHDEDALAQQLVFLLGSKSSGMEIWPSSQIMWMFYCFIKQTVFRIARI